MISKTAVNCILQTEQNNELTLGHCYSFTSTHSQNTLTGSQIWLTDTNLTALAEISIISQSLKNNKLSGQYRVNYLYKGEEQKTITQMFVRMFEGELSPYIYLLSSQAEYEQALQNGQLIRDSIKTEGFIHASPKNQLNRVANKFYKNTHKPLLLTVEKEKILSTVKYEPAKGGLYPHIYGPLNINAVVKALPISTNKNGDFEL
ncbi:DUF952 domain-containing protein [Catenovulum adriaticum]|uniref:DUF952 domain-containing protein n=1 Tax=Catenovulum adriaticum TaxID=2984846 RepID=A0ABY7AS35_9ALTE|nr:DUF952 domain-containing protein [Catenovulum sp. TS8]WAJ72294.1 DUF952 domain-containing protein [Catenovulum sp. TS8]